METGNTLRRSSRQQEAEEWAHGAPQASAASAPEARPKAAFFSYSFAHTPSPTTATKACGAPGGLQKRLVFYSISSFFTLILPLRAALHMTPRIPLRQVGVHLMGCCIPTEIDYNPERTCLPACPNTSRWIICAPCYPGGWRKPPSRRKPEQY